MLSLHVTELDPRCPLGLLWCIYYFDNYMYIDGEFFSVYTVKRGCHQDTLLGCWELVRNWHPPWGVKNDTPMWMSQVHSNLCHQDTFLWCHQDTFLGCHQDTLLGCYELVQNWHPLWGVKNDTTVDVTSTLQLVSPGHVLWCHHDTLFGVFRFVRNWHPLWGVKNDTPTWMSLVTPTCVTMTCFWGVTSHCKNEMPFDVLKWHPYVDVTSGLQLVLPEHVVYCTWHTPRLSIQCSANTPNHTTECLHNAPPNRHACPHNSPLDTLACSHSTLNDTFYITYQDSIKVLVCILQQIQ